MMLYHKAAMGVVTKEKSNALQRRMARLCVYEEDLIEKFILGSGPGGQKINKTASCVYLKHLPSGIEVKCGQKRSRELNRFLARRHLCEQIEKNKFGIKSPKDKKIEKIQRQKNRRKRRQKPQNSVNK